jgi:hypothetical protein
VSGSLNIAGEVSGASAALAGLILVFFGSALSSFDTYSVEQQNSVRWSYRRRAWPAFVGFVAAIISCGMARYAKAETSDAAAGWGVGLLAFAGVAVFLSALQALRDIG